MQRNLERMEHAHKITRVGKISGAVGTYANVDPFVEKYVCEQMGLEPSPISTQVLQRDRYAELLSVIAITGCSLEKFATEVRGLQKTELREVEELFRSGHPIQKNRLVLVHQPEGTVHEPVRTESGQYLGRPVYHNGQVILLLVDFPKEEINILTFHETAGTTEPLAVLPLSIVEDCYNLRMEAPPLMLTRSAHDNKFQILWPERRDFAIEDHEFFEFVEGNRLYTTVWYEDPDYREEVLVRDYETGEVLERIPGSLRQMPDGQRWLLV